MQKFDVMDLLLISPALVLFLTSLIPLLIKVLRGNREPHPFISSLYVLSGIALSGVLSLLTYSARTTAFYGTLQFDGLSALSNLILIMILGFTVIYSREHKEISKRLYSEFLFLLLNAVVGMMVLSWANHFIIVFIGIEMMSLSLYILITMSAEEMRSKEAALKYFILGSVASAVFLYGCALLYGTSGTADFLSLKNQAAQLMVQSKLFLIGAILFFVGVAFKLALVPFHSWSPDVYQGSPTPLVNLMSTGVKISSFILLLRFITLGVGNEELSLSFFQTIQWIAVLTILIGNLGALKQNSFKRLFAYSGISHSGYMLMGILVAGQGETSGIGVSALLFYLCSYVLVSFGSFAFLSLYERQIGNEILIEDVKGLANRNPMIAIFMSILLLSMAGLPPLLGFFSKFFIFAAAISHGYYWLVFWAVIGSIIGVYYYLKPIAYMFMSEEITLGPDLKAMRLSAAAFVLASVLTLVLGVFSNSLLTSLSSALQLGQ